MLGTAVVFQDVWDAGRALDLIELEQCSFQVGATPFLHAMTHHPGLADRDVTSLRVFGCGGADVSPQLVRQATQRLGCTVVRLYGSSEFPTVSGGVPSDPLDLRAETDGRIIGRAEVQVRSADGLVVSAGETGELHVRGPERFLGYQDRDASERAIDKDGWFRTGDLGTVDADGYLVIQGREKDIIIRGGENISCKEVEDLLLEHESVEDVAVVAMPDRVMVERVCAYVVPCGGNAPPAMDLVGFLQDANIARQKIPERFEFVSELPRTPSGKIKKFELRAHIASIIKAEQEAE
jgi:cyclohexanecarboxylate-CoA ligase